MALLQLHDTLNTRRRLHGLTGSLRKWNCFKLTEINKQNAKIFGKISQYTNLPPEQPFWDTRVEMMGTGTRAQSPRKSCEGLRGGPGHRLPNIWWHFCELLLCEYFGKMLEKTLIVHMQTVRPHNKHGVKRRRSERQVMTCTRSWTLN